MQSDYGIEKNLAVTRIVVCASALHAMGRGEVMEHWLRDLFFGRGVWLVSYGQPPLFMRSF